MPYTHLRTFEQSLFNKAILSNVHTVLDGDGNFLRAGGDTAFFYNLIENADLDRIIAVPHVVYHYNDLSPLNDYKINGEEQTRTAVAVLQSKYVPGVSSQTKLISKIEGASTITPSKKTRILVAIPTAKYIEVETFKSLWDLDVPDDVVLDFRYTYGYTIVQLRNLIASWTVDGLYDYLFSVDSDIVLPKDTLTKLLNHNKDIVSGVYIQRKANMEVPEIYRWKGNAMLNVSMDEILPAGLHPIAGCGFGCVLVKSEVFRKIGYPQFDYKMHSVGQIQYSEDTYFCNKAAENGFEIYVDSSIVCGHIGSHTYLPKI